MFRTSQPPVNPVDVGAPFDRPAFRADLGDLAGSTRRGWQQWAAEAVLIAGLAGQVPREPFDQRGATAWTSFVREIAVARRCTDQAAGKEVFLAVALTRSHPRTLALLQAGQLPAGTAQALIEESIGLSPDALAEVESELAERACRLSPSRVRDAVRKIELSHDADAAAVRAAKAAAGRSVRVLPQPDAQADLVVSGPALPVVAFFESLTAAARAAKAAGDPRGLDALRFDLALDLPAPDSATPDPDVTGEAGAEAVPDAAPGASAEKCAGAAPAALGPRPRWLEDRRRVRPVQVLIHLPVTTALGLDNEPGWLSGYGWISAPQCRQWLASAELRQVCIGTDGTPVDLADHAVRPAPTPEGVRAALLDMVAAPGRITAKTWHTEPRHDPSAALSEFVDVRDRFCDGPTGTRVPATRCDKDHNSRYPQGPTAAWNLRTRAARTHQLKHRGWTPVQTPTSTLWFSPAGQVVDVERHTDPPPHIDPEPWLPDPQQLHQVDAEMTREPGPDDESPWCEPPPF